MSDQPNSNQPNTDAEHAELVNVFESSQESEALVVQALLESAGIESLLSSIFVDQDVLPGVGGGMALQVSPANADRARQLIEEYRTTPETEILELDDDSAGEDDFGTPEPGA